MSFSPNYHDFTQQLEAIQRRLTALSERLEGEREDPFALRSEWTIELNTVLQMLQTLQASNLQRPDPEQFEQLQRLVQEKTLLLQEIHHRIRNNFQIVLSLLDIQALQSGDSRIQALLQDNQNRIRSIALVHEKLSRSENFATINLGEYIQELAEILVRSYAIQVSQVTLRTAIEANVTISPERVMPVGLILNELVTNALKHGLGNGAGTIRVTLTLTSDQIAILTVSNTGQAFSQPEELTPQSFGLQLITNLLQQIDGVLSYPESDASPDRYNQVQISFAVSS